MRTQRLEYLDTLDILFSGRSATGPQAAGIKKILAPTEESPIDPCLDEANPTSLSSDSDTEEQPSTIIKKTPQPARSIRQGKKRAAEEIDGIDGKENPRHGKKIKKLTGGEQIASEMNYWTMQNAASLEAHRIEKLKPEARVMEDLNTNYQEELEELNLSEFTALVITLKTVNSMYANGTAADYYLMLGPGKLREQFVENLFESLHNDA